MECLSDSSSGKIINFSIVDNNSMALSYDRRSEALSTTRKCILHFVSANRPFFLIQIAGKCIVRFEEYRGASKEEAHGLRTCRFGGRLTLKDSTEFFIYFI